MQLPATSCARRPPPNSWAIAPVTTTGFFGMNFEALPLIHNRIGFWIAFGLMVLVGLGFVVYFRRKRYLGATR